MSSGSLPVEELFRNNSRCRIIELFVDKSDSNDTYRNGEIADRIGKTQETVRKAINPDDITSLVGLGIIEVVDPEATITHYKQAETPVVEYLQETPWKEIANCFNSRTTPKLSKFVLQYGSPDKEYSKTKIREKTGISNRGFENNLELFIDLGLIEKIEYEQYVYPKYQINLDSEIADQIYTLNELLYEQFVEQQKAVQ